MLGLCASPYWVRTNTQRAGRGRSGRKWVSQNGDLLASFVTTWKSVQTASQLSFVAALALFETLADYGVPDLAIKWPNDVLIGDRKIAGILVEYVNEHVIIGIGVNLVSAPNRSQLDPRSFDAVALSEFVQVTPRAFLAKFDVTLNRILGIFRAYGFTSIRSQLANHLWVRGELVYDNGNSRELVRVIGIDESGALEIDGDAGRRKVFAGDLLLR